MFKHSSASTLPAAGERRDSSSSALHRLLDWSCELGGLRYFFFFRTELRGDDNSTLGELRKRALRGHLEAALVKPGVFLPSAGAGLYEHN